MQFIELFAGGGGILKEFNDNKLVVTCPKGGKVLLRADNGDIEIICTNTKCLKKWNVFIKSGQIRYEPVEKQENAS